jgi:hypothetical protein
MRSLAAKATSATLGSEEKRFPVGPGKMAARQAFAQRHAPENAAPQWDFGRIRISRSHEPIGTIQRRLRIGATDDPLEREADRAADQVMRMPDHVVVRRQGSCGGECEDCRRKGRTGGAASGAMPAVLGEVLSRPGRPLDAGTRSFFEPRFGHDFGKVRVHTDTQAAESARSVNAVAYAVGSDVVFDSGQYAPQTDAGRRLLAHELAHVLQQDCTSVRRQPPPPPTPSPLPATVPLAGPSDFEIAQVGTSTKSGIFFAKNSSTLDTAANTQITAIKTSAPSSVRLLGFSSADETGTVAQDRANRVKAALTATPHPVTVASAVGDATAQAARSEFSEARTVEIVVGSATPTTLNCAATDPVTHALINPPKQACDIMDPPTKTAFNTAQPMAFDATKRAAAAVASTPSANDAKVIDQFFGNHDVGTVSTLKTNLKNLKDHVDNLPASTQCGGQCDIGLCASGPIAYNSGVDAASTMTLCVPTFKSLGSTNDRVRNLIHESAHGTSPLGGTPTSGTADVAYRHERMIFELAPADRLRNSDSYALFALFLREKQVTGDPTAVPGGISTPAADIRTGFDPTTEEPALKLAIAKLEKRLSWASDWISQLYGQVLEVRTGATTWAASWANDLMAETAKRLPVAPPAAPPAKPSLTDQIRIAGLADRFRRMHESAQQDLTMTRMAAGVVKWGAPPVVTVGAIPPQAWLAGDSLQVGPDFFKATAADQISLLLEALAKVTRDVEPAFIPAYVSLAAWIHSKKP